MTDQATIPAAGGAVSAPDDVIEQTLKALQAEADGGAPAELASKPAETPPSDDKAKTAAEAAEAETKAADEAKKARQQTFNERLGTVVRERNSARKELADARAEIERLRKPLATNVEDLDYDQRERLRTREALREERLAEVTERAKETAGQERAAIEQERALVHEEVVAKVAQANDPALATALETMPLTEIGVDLLNESERAADLVKALAADNNKLARELYHLTDPRRADASSVARAATLLARLESKLGAPAPAVQSKKTTNAPAPGTTLNGGPPPVGRELSEMGMADFAPAFLKQLEAQH